MSRPFGAIAARRWRRHTGLCGLAGLSGLLALACVEQQEDKPTPEDQEYVTKNLLSAAPTPQFKVDADLDGKVVYLGLDAAPNPVEPGKDVKVTQYWKVVSPPGEGWRLFNHVSGPNNAGYQNRDHGPMRGKYPVAQWKAATASSVNGTLPSVCRALRQKPSRTRVSFSRRRSVSLMA